VETVNPTLTMSVAFQTSGSTLASRRTFAETTPNLVGDTKYSILSADHDRWMLCDGRLLSTRDHPALFRVIGYTFGGGGSRFALPDARGRISGVVGQTRPLGNAVGSETHTLQVPELAAHTHAIANSATGITLAAAGTHSHTASASTEGAHNHTVANTVQYGENTRIEADGNGDNELNLDASTTTTTSTAGSHTHTITVDASGNHNHTLTDPTHTHTAAVVGSNRPFSIMQPTLFMGNMFIFVGRQVAALIPFNTFQAQQRALAGRIALARMVPPLPRRAIQRRSFTGTS